MITVLRPGPLFSEDDVALLRFLRVASILREIKRDVDVAARSGGEELCLILPTPISRAEGDKNSLIAAADAAQYAAKRAGKNRTVRAGARTADILGDRVPRTEPEA